MTRFECVDAQKAAGFPVTAACAAMEVSTSGFYEWQARVEAGPTVRQLADAELVVLIRQLHHDSDGTYGLPRIALALRKAGVKVNHKKLRRLMREAGIVGRYTPPRLRTTIGGPDHPVIEDLLRRRFAPGAVDVTWVQDITFVATREGWLYLAGVIDLGSRRLLGYSMADHMRAELVVDALDMAVAARGRASMNGTIAHADQGSQYTSHTYLNWLHAHGLRPSLGSVRDCFDNAVAESFWATLKRECINGQIYRNHSEARRAIFAWINRYNHRRIHTTLGGLTPTEWEQQYQQEAA